MAVVVDAVVGVQKAFNCLDCGGPKVWFYVVDLVLVCAEGACVCVCVCVG